MADKPKTVEVRVAVVVAPDGTWGASGWQSMSEENAHCIAYDGYPNGSSLHWITAELSIPEVAEVRADVEGV